MTSHFSGQASECEVASHRYTASLAQASFPEWNLDHPTARAQSPLERGSRLACQAQDPQTSAHQRWESCDWSLLGWASDWCLSDWCLSGSGSSGLSSSRMRILWLKLIGLKLVRLSVRPQVAQSTTLCIVIQHLRWRVDICHPWSSTSQWSDEYQTWTWLTWSWKSFGKGEKLHQQIQLIINRSWHEIKFIQISQAETESMSYHYCQGKGHHCLHCQGKGQTTCHRYVIGQATYFNNDLTTQLLFMQLSFSSIAIGQ